MAEHKQLDSGLGRVSGVDNQKTLVILEKLRKKGWNAYESGSSNEASIRAGPTEKLKLDTRYVVLPAVKRSKDPKQIFEKLEEIALRRDRAMPEITISGVKHSWVGFTPHGRYFKVSTPQGHLLSFDEFSNALETIMQV